MSEQRNLKLMESIFEAIVAGETQPFVDALADEVTMTVTGSYSWSQTFTGKESVLTDLYGYVMSRLSTPIVTVPQRFLGARPLPGDRLKGPVGQRPAMRRRSRAAGLGIGERQRGERQRMVRAFGSGGRLVAGRPAPSATSRRGRHQRAVPGTVVPVTIRLASGHQGKRLPALR
jgi:hypothetical protein